jgi:hypothetical protein
MSDALTAIKNFRTVLCSDPAEEDAKKWWDHIERIESTLCFDPKFSAYEKKLLQSLKNAVTDVIVACRDGLNPHTSQIGIPLTALQDAIERRSIGSDGWPLRN